MTVVGNCASGEDSIGPWAQSYALAVFFPQNTLLSVQLSYQTGRRFVDNQNKQLSSGRQSTFALLVCKGLHSFCTR